MQRLITRALLPLALTLTLAACNDEPEAGTDATPTASSTPDKAPVTATVKAPPKLPDTASPYERAMQALSSGTSLRFETEVMLGDGSMQYANGVSSENNYAFSVRSLPKPNPDLDGNWYFSGGRYQRESSTGYDSTVLVPSAIAILVQTLDMLPKTQSALASDPPVVETAIGGGCQSRKVNLPQNPSLLGKYKDISVCVDESNVRLLKLEAQLQSGEHLLANYSDYGLPVQMPQVKVFDWSQEFPRR